MSADPVIFLMGPTATGKTALGIELVARFPLEIISVDSALVYRGMDIGTGKPTADELARAPHHLVDVCEVYEPYSAARFCADASDAIKRIHTASKVPLLVGGTGLYFRALRDGLSALPKADQSIRQRIRERAETLGWPALHAELLRADPVSGARIHPNDPQRIQRALEVLESSGRPMSSLMTLSSKPQFPYSVACSITLVPGDRARLHARIEERFRGMLDRGLVSEVEGLRADARIGRELPAMRAVGYRQVWDYLDDVTNYPTMVDKALASTRQLAKRQLTWLRAERNTFAQDCFSGTTLDVATKMVESALSA